MVNPVWCCYAVISVIMLSKTTIHYTCAKQITHISHCGGITS